MLDNSVFETFPIGSDVDTIDYGDISSAKIIDAAEGLNCEIFYPSDFQLTIDLDNDKDFRYFQRQYARFQFSFGFSSYVVLKSRHNNRHVIVSLKIPIEDVKERVILQTILGSDRIREALTLLRIKRNDPHPSILLRPRP